MKKLKIEILHYTTRGFLKSFPINSIDSSINLALNIGRNPLPIAGTFIDRTEHSSIFWKKNYNVKNFPTATLSMFVS